MREIDVSLVTEAVKKLYIETNYRLGADVKACLKRCAALEETESACSVFDSIEKNIEIAEEGVFPLCQDTGMACVFLQIGQDVHFTGGNLNDAVNEGVRRGCLEGYLRQTIVADPFRRTNTGDSTPADISVDIVPGDVVKVIVAPKGFGSENMSAIKMLPPAAGVRGAEDFIVETVKAAGPNSCPPVVVGVGIGGNFSKVALMAKKALLRPIGTKEGGCCEGRNPDPFYAEMEQRLLDRINGLNIGPQGFGGRTTALAVNIIAAPTHIAGLPVAVNINCHVSRHGEVVL
ncbi:MAG: fumarate hydratase [Lentihominibacter sp.]